MKKYLLGLAVSVFACIYADTPGLFVTSSGNAVGIGTNQPHARLDVSGNALIQDTLTVQGVVNVSSNRVTNVGTPSASSDAATKDYVDSSISSALPSGSVIAYAGSSAPGGWLVCNGAEVSRATYANLFSALGTTYGAGNGTTTFNLPDLRGRVVLGVGQGSGLSNRSLASNYGTENAQLAVENLPSHVHSIDHNHTINDPGHSHASSVPPGSFGLIRRSSSGEAVTPTATDDGGSGSEPDVNTTPAAIPSTTTGITVNAVSANSGATGSGTAFSIVQPAIALNYIVKI